VNVESFNSVKEGSFFVAVQYLHNFVHRPEGMAFFIKVFCEAVGLVIVSEGSFVFFVSHEESSTSLSYVSFVAIRVGEFVCS